MEHFDLVIVGTGSGNSILDERFADQKVALIEHGVFGGTCLNVGCIPTKMFVYAADAALTTRRSERLGVDAHVDQVRWRDIRDRIFGRIDPIAAGGREYRSQHPDNANVTVFEGTAVFSGPRQLTVTPNAGGPPQTITASQIVLAAGGRPILPDVPGLDELHIHTSDTVMRLPELPRRVTILGSGFIAAEFAHIFGSLGAQVTIIARSGLMLRAEDADIAERFTELATDAWDLRLRRKVVRAEHVDGEDRLHLEGPTGAEVVASDVVLVAVGRRPNTDRLNVQAGGLATTDDGHLVVDDYQRTTAEGIWALGDISTSHELKHVANHEERVVQHNLLYPDAMVSSDHRFVPHAVFSEPQVAAVGLSEQQARQRGFDYVTAIQDYADIAYGWAMEETTGFAKVIADPNSRQLLGAHIIGPQASALIQPLIQAMSFGLDVDSMARGQYWIHPALPELVENALLKLPPKG